MKAAFCRKFYDLDELEYCTNGAEKNEPFMIDEVMELSAEEWKAFTSNFFVDYAWLSQKGGLVKSKAGVVRRRCILAYTEKDERALLIDPQGYTYARYTALIDKQEAFEYAGHK